MGHGEGDVSARVRGRARRGGNGEWFGSCLRRGGGCGSLIRWIRRGVLGRRGALGMGPRFVRIRPLSLRVVLGESVRGVGLSLAEVTLSGALLVGAVLGGVPGGSLRMARAVGWRVARPFVRVSRVLGEIVPRLFSCVRGAGGVVSLALRPGVGGPEGLS